MSKDAHFIVVVKEDGTFDYDFDVSINFDAGQIWDTEKEEWSTPDESIEHNNIYTDALLILTSQLMLTNESNKKEMQ